MQPYSLDLRQKILTVYLKESPSQRQLAQRFGVTLSFIQTFLKRYRQTGSIAPKTRTQQTPPKLNQAHLDLLRELVQQHNDATLAELADLLHQATGIRVSTSTMDRTLKKLQLTRKKNTPPQGKRK